MFKYQRILKVKKEIDITNENSPKKKFNLPYINTSYIFIMEYFN